MSKYDLLPPNATQIERDLSRSMSVLPRVERDVPRIADQKYRNIPNSLLPFLIFEYGLGELIPYLPDMRVAISEGILWQRIRGTPRSLIQALSWIGITAQIDTYNERTERWAYYELSLDNNSLTPEKYYQVLAIAQLAQPLRSRLDRIYGIYNRRRFSLDRSLLSGGDLLSDDSGTTPGGGTGNPQESFGHVVSNWIQYDRPVVSGNIASLLPSWLSWWESFTLDWHLQDEFVSYGGNSTIVLNTWGEARGVNIADYLPGWAPDLSWLTFDWQGNGIKYVSNCRITSTDSRVGLYSSVFARGKPAASLTSTRVLAPDTLAVNVTVFAQLQSSKTIAAGITPTPTLTANLISVASGILQALARTPATLDAALSSNKDLSAGAISQVNPLASLQNYQTLSAQITAIATLQATLIGGNVNYLEETITAQNTLVASLLSLQNLQSNLDATTEALAGLQSINRLTGSIASTITLTSLLSTLQNSQFGANVSVNSNASATLNSAQTLQSGVSSASNVSGTLTSLNFESGNVAVLGSLSANLNSSNNLATSVLSSAIPTAALTSTQTLVADFAAVVNVAAALQTASGNFYQGGILTSGSVAAALTSGQTLPSANFAAAVNVAAALQSTNFITANLQTSVSLGGSLISTKILVGNISVNPTVQSELTHTGGTWRAIAWDSTNYPWSNG